MIGKQFYSDFRWGGCGVGFGVIQGHFGNKGHPVGAWAVAVPPLWAFLGMLVIWGRFSQNGSPFSTRCGSSTLNRKSQ